MNTCEWPEQRNKKNLQRDLEAVNRRVRNSISAHMTEKKGNILKFVLHSDWLAISLLFYVSF